MFISSCSVSLLLSTTMERGATNDQTVCRIGALTMTSLLERSLYSTIATEGCHLASCGPNRSGRRYSLAYDLVDWTLTALQCVITAEKIGKTVSQGFVSSLAEIVYAQAGMWDDCWLYIDLTEAYSDHGYRFRNVCKVSYLHLHWIMNRMYIHQWNSSSRHGRRSTISMDDVKVISGVKWVDGYLIHYVCWFSSVLVVMITW